MIVNITTRSDSDFGASFAYVNTSNVAIDMTGYTLKMEARTSGSDVQAFLTLSTANGNAVVNSPASNGIFTITIPMAILAALPQNTYVHSLIATLPSEVHVEIWHGTLIHSIGPTR